MADADAVFEWGVGVDDYPETSNNILINDGTVGFVGRVGGLAGGEEYTLGEKIDVLNFMDEDDPGVLRRGPIPRLYFYTRFKNMASATIYFLIRVDYDVVTLSATEQLDMARKYCLPC